MHGVLLDCAGKIWLVEGREMVFREREQLEQEREMIMEHRGSMQRLGCLKKTGGHMLCEPGGPRASGALSVRQRGTA